GPSGQPRCHSRRLGAGCVVRADRGWRGAVGGGPPWPRPGGGGVGWGGGGGGPPLSPFLGGGPVTATTTICDAGAGGPVSPTSSHLMTHPDAAASHGFSMSLISGGHLVMLLAHLAAAGGVGGGLGAGRQ